ncbi:hypothetical protein OG874_11180 [Nocardia sp. NBC_00565]|uniref:hypothetical protein n=1 Tax=Nocardia sp. NBC_00565 TaxID=2975993 RepID=UPI002E80E35B|nr:hypothetical protein [Nocardia sp. NBC_00565]WUC05661.1 hypothetical protein OG874_11180 [Nocardia sp. NBC_00565]
MADDVDPDPVTADRSGLEAARAQALAAQEAAKAALAEAEAAAAALDRQLEQTNADVADKPEQTTAGVADKPVARSPKRRRVAAVALIAVVTIAAAGASAYFAIAHRDAVHQADERLDYVQAARQGVVNILSVDFNSANNDVKRILEDATGAWREEFAPQAQPFTDVVQKSKVVTTAEVTAAGLEHRNDDGTAQVLVAAKSKVSNSAGASNEQRTFRLRVTVAPDAGRLKIAKMEYVPS